MQSSAANLESLTQELAETKRCLLTAQYSLERMTQESAETKLKLEKQIVSIEEEHKTQLSLKVMEHDLIVKDLKQEKETNTKRLTKLMDTQKAEYDKIVFELKENLEKRTNECADLTGKIKEFEETLAKDKDERIQRLLDTQHNLEKEIESLKAALDIKSLDIFDLRTKNNELITKVDNYTELNIKLRRYKQEVEQLSATLSRKQEAER